MRKLLLGACVAVACWMSDAEGMKCKTEDGQEISSIVKCESRNRQFVMINRWELGNESYMSECKYLHIDYKGIKEKFNREKSKADITDEMKNILYTLPTCIGNFSSLKVLCVHGYVNDRVGLYSCGIYLRVLPDSIGNLTNLRILDLSDNHLETLPDSIGNLENLEELRLSNNYRFSKLPGSIGNLKKLEVLNLGKTNLSSLPVSLENLTNLKELYLSKAVEKEGPHTYGVNRSSEYVYGDDSYSPDWYRDVINRFLEHWSCPTIDYGEANTLALDLSRKNLKQIPFGVYMMDNSRYNNYNTGTCIPELEELDVSNNQITEIPRLMKRLSLKKLYIHNNPNLNHLPDFLWEMRYLKELKIDGKLIKDLPKNTEYSLDNENLEDAVLSLTLDGKNNKKMSDEELSKRTGPYIVYLKK